MNGVLYFVRLNLSVEYLTNAASRRVPSSSSGAMIKRLPHSSGSQFAVLRPVVSVYRLSDDNFAIHKGRRMYIYCGRNRNNGLDFTRCKADERIRAVLLVGSRANPDIPEYLPDYDITYFVKDVRLSVIPWVENVSASPDYEMPEAMRYPKGDGHLTI